jgi:predicted histone-like DNA-binding protein
MDPRDLSQPGKFYARLTNRYKITFQELMEEISMVSSVSIGDTFNVLHTLNELLQKHLENGRSISLGNLGDFYISVNSRAEETPEKVDVNSIIKSNVRFRPGWGLKEALRRLRFQKAMEGKSPPKPGQRKK